MKMLPIAAGLAFAIASAATCYAQSGPGCQQKAADTGNNPTLPQRAADAGNNPSLPQRAADAGNNPSLPQKAAEGNGTIACKG
jgi:hypothetical protein